MEVISVRNVHAALPEGLRYLQHAGVRRDSRNGPVLVAPGPVTTLYARPWERVTFWPERDANPFFHFFEGLWMLAGRRDVKFLTRFVPRMKDFSDDGQTFHGAYGYRWLNHFDVEGGGHSSLPDQLNIIVNRLSVMPDNRRCVLTMWDPVADLGANTKDAPCNTQAYFGIGANGALDMTVCCRSNDVVLGAYGANAVHFSMMQEYVARVIGVAQGRYWQMSNNYHAYVNDDYDKVAHLSEQASSYAGHRTTPYSSGAVSDYCMMSVPKKIWDEDLSIFMDQGPITGFREPFFRQVVTPLWYAHGAFKAGDLPGALEILEKCQATDWRLAATEWIQRRIARHAERENA